MLGFVQDLEANRVENRGRGEGRVGGGEGSVHVPKSFGLAVAYFTLFVAQLNAQILAVAYYTNMSFFDCLISSRLSKVLLQLKLLQSGKQFRNYISRLPELLTSERLLS